MINRQLARSKTYLIRGARIFVGDGKVIESGAILVRDGKIAEVFEGEGPDPRTVKATLIEAEGKTILPGLIDVHVHLGGPGGFVTNMRTIKPEAHMERNLAAYLYSGVTSVRSVGDLLDPMLNVRGIVNNGEKLGAQVFTCGPLFTAHGGHGTEFFKDVPENIRKQLKTQFTRLPASTEEARQQVDSLKQDNVDCIKAIMESGGGSELFNRMDVSYLQAIVHQAHADNFQRLCIPVMFAM